MIDERFLNRVKPAFPAFQPLDGYYLVPIGHVPITMGMILSLPMILAGVILWLRSRTA